MIKNICTILSAISAASARSTRDPLKFDKNIDLLDDDDNWVQGTDFTSKLDNWNDTSKEFALRYWENNSTWDKQNHGPVFLYICGEWTCAPPSTDQAAFTLGQRLNANLLALEHRFYGDSSPFKDDPENATSFENLKFLSSEQALQDIANFIDFKNQQWGWPSHQWVVIGGSYPGALSAWFKSQYPDFAVAAWSSSGVINAIEDFTIFDFDIYNSSIQSG